MTRPDSRRETAKCAGCGKEFETTIWIRKDGTELAPDTLCHECRIEKQRQEDIAQYKQDLADARVEQREAWKKLYGVEGIFRRKSFGDFERELQPKAYDSVKGYHDCSLVLLSPGVYGVGKTHLVCALANYLVETREPAKFQEGCYRIVRCPCPVHVTTETKLLARIRRTYNRSDNVPAETEDMVYSSLARYQLLVIDDVGKVRPKDYSFLQGVYFSIIDDRYVKEQQIIITTNLDFQELEEHIGGASADRLREMCGREGFIKMAGKSYRH